MGTAGVGQDLVAEENKSNAPALISGAKPEAKNPFGIGRHRRLRDERGAIS
jgi:hypothetical protein